MNDTQTALAVIQARAKEYMPILRELIVGGRRLTDEQIIGRAMFAASQELDPITEVHTIVSGDGKTLAHTMAINGLRRKNQEFVGPGNEILVQFVEMPKDKLPQGAAYGYECHLRDGQSYTQWQKRVVEIGKALRETGITPTFEQLMAAAGSPPVTVGVGVIYVREANDYKDTNFNPIERAKKRAEVNARHHRFPTRLPVYDGENGGAVIVEAKWEDAPAEQPEPPKPPKTELEILSELGFDAPPPEAAPAPAAAPTPTVYPPRQEKLFVQGGDTTEAQLLGELGYKPEPPQPKAKAARHDVVTKFWTKAVELGIPHDEGLAHLKEYGNDFEAALKALL
jgi:hypothetical protein